MKLTLIFCLFIAFGYGQSFQNVYKKSFPLGQWLDTTKRQNPDELLSFFVKSDSFSSLNQLINEQKGLYKGGIKDWQFVAIPRRNIIEFIESETVKTVNFRTYQPVVLNDSMRVKNRINAIHRGHQLSKSYKGKGVVVGFIDTGIDISSPDMMNPLDSSTRVLALWDQTQGVSVDYTPSKYGYGRSWTKAQIDAGLSSNNDNYGHGTLVAGSACSNGFANGLHKGVAPLSDIVMVKTNFLAANWLSTVVDAVDYIYAVADAQNKPCVINASVGTYMGSHDGLDPYALMIDSLINRKKGHLLVGAMGNSGGFRPYHLHADFTSDTVFTLAKPNPTSNLPHSLQFELWADTASFDVKFRINVVAHNPSYNVRGKGQWLEMSNIISTLKDTIYNTSRQQLAIVNYSGERRDAQYLLQVAIVPMDTSNYYASFETAGTGRYDIWSPWEFKYALMGFNADTIGNLPIHQYIKADSLQSIVSSFQCSPNVISVGNYNNEKGYYDVDSIWRPHTGTVEGELASTSSRGPTRTGTLKPNLCASGQQTLSSYPRWLINWHLARANQRHKIAYGGEHRNNGGTSMASPVVAGLGALLLEKCPQMTQQQFQTYLTQNTYRDGFTGSNLPNIEFGYGKLDGHQTLKATNFSVRTHYSDSVCEKQTQFTSSFNNFQAVSINGVWKTDSINTVATDKQFVLVGKNEWGCLSDTTRAIVYRYPFQANSLTRDKNGVTVSLNSQDSIVQWYENHLPLSLWKQHIQRIVPRKKGVYYATIKNKYGCLKQSDTLFFTMANEKYSIYPNPVYDNKSIRIDAVETIENVLFIDEMGRLVKSFDNATKSNTMLFNPNISAGSYVVKIKLKTKWVEEKIIVIK